MYYTVIQYSGVLIIIIIIMIVLYLYNGIGGETPPSLMDLN